jgi:molybdopterin-guanine dinucleotide biosynthesis protein A
MGVDKAKVQLAGQPLIVRALEILRQAGLTASIAGARTQLSSFAPVVADSELDRGPLGGICAALDSTTARRAVFIPVDLPLLPASLVTFLLEQAESCGAAIAVVEVNGFMQTFPVVLDRAVLPTLHIELEAGRGACLAAFQTASRVLGRPAKVVSLEAALRAGDVVHPHGLPAECWFLNVNTAADIVRAEAYLARRVP